MNLNQLNYKQYENNSQCKNQPFGSMPREDSSLRMMRLIQADMEASPSISRAFLTAFSRSGSILKAICLLPLGKFTLFVFDTCFTLIYDLSCVRHCKTRAINNQAPDVVATHSEALTNNLTKDKTMADPNNTLYTAQGVSKIYLFLGVSRQDLANTRLNLKTFPRSRIAIQAHSEQSARAKLAKNWLLLQSWSFKNLSEVDRTFIKGVIYA
ncbi:hypothetical protein [Rodentibacter ratti]|uniref:Uncharacterized protein n=1 Tax=Rodentibacter ratti TaxID=1906745 RepID=A0A1V3LCL9_9PAST|nr:hypothetical protein [Rodentibacter ratti]OOF87803.1 hypothetical protein BKG88_00975 [Rodentibacter ratti]